MLGAFSDAGATPDIAQLDNTKQTTLALVAAGVGFGLVPAMSSRLCPLAVSFVDVDPSDGLPDVRLSLIWRTDSSPLVDNFVNLALQHI